MTEAETAAWLCTAAAVRDRCGAMLALAEADALPHFAVQPGRLPAVADYTAAVIRSAYPSLAIPHHARWRHFAAAGVDRWAALGRALGPMDPAALARVRIDLCVVSVLLDAGAGPGWSFREPGTGLLVSRSEGLAVASVHAFRAGLFSSRRAPEADAPGLQAVTAAALGEAFGVCEGNPLAGLEGRAALLRNLGGALTERPDLFPGARVGGLFDALATSGALQAADLLAALLDGLGPVWPPRTVLAGRSLGDVWPHPAMSERPAELPFPPAGEGRGEGLVPEGAARPSDHLVPFHKLSQWLTYSLLEVFEDAGIVVSGTGALTGLAEYRNGGLFLDGGVLRLKDPALAASPLTPGHPAVVEWRALTVALLDRLAPLIRERLGRDEASLPLSRILEGGTWAAGRAMAAERRRGGGPPLQIVSDGTVF